MAQGKSVFDQLPLDLRKELIRRCIAQRQGITTHDAMRGLRNDLTADHNMGGFTWGNAPEGHIFWASILYPAFQGRIKEAIAQWRRIKKHLKPLSSSPAKSDKPTKCAPPEDRSVTKENVYVGMRVVRGRDWEWDNQDCNGMGVSQPGTVIREPDLEGWVRVQWDANGDKNSYRVGGNCETLGEGYDLYIYQETEETEIEYEI